MVQSSPYLRSLMTAAETAKVLGVKTIDVNYMLAEWMKGKFFESNPIDTLLIRNRDPKVISEKYLGGIQILDKAQKYDPENKPRNRDEKAFAYVRNSYPEAWPKSYARAQEVQRQLYWAVRNFKGSSKFEGDHNQQKIAILSFSHGALV